MDVMMEILIMMTEMTIMHSLTIIFNQCHNAKHLCMMMMKIMNAIQMMMMMIMNAILIMMMMIAGDCLRTLRKKRRGWVPTLVFISSSSTRSMPSVKPEDPLLETQVNQHAVHHP